MGHKIPFEKTVSLISELYRKQELPTKLKPYFVSGREFEDISIIVYDFTARKARNTGYDDLLDFRLVENITDARVKLIKAQWPFDACNLELAVKNIPHVVVESELITCRICEQWGRLNRIWICKNCYDEIEFKNIDDSDSVRKTIKEKNYEHKEKIDNMESDARLMGLGLNERKNYHGKY